jgi:hypothetical protein
MRQLSCSHSTSTVTLLLEWPFVVEEVAKIVGQFVALIRESMLAAFATRTPSAGTCMTFMTWSTAAFWMTSICSGVAANEKMLKKKVKKPIDLLRELYKALHIEIKYILRFPYYDI